MIFKLILGREILGFRQFLYSKIKKQRQLQSILTIWFIPPREQVAPYPSNNVLK